MMVACKQWVVEDLLANYPVVAVACRATLGADVNGAEDQVTIHIGLALAQPIPDLVVDRDGISGTLKFSSGLARVRVPWRSVFCASVAGADDPAFLWLDEAPDEVRARAEALSDRAADNKREPEKPRTGLRLVTDEDDPGVS